MSELDKVLQGRLRLMEGQSPKECSPSTKPVPPKKPQLPPKNINPQVASKIKASLAPKPPLPTTKPKLHPLKQTASKSVSDVDSSSSPGVAVLANLLRGGSPNGNSADVNGTSAPASLPRRSKPSHKSKSVEIQKPCSESVGADRPFSASIESSDEFFSESPRSRASPVVTPTSSPLLHKKRSSSMSPSKSVDSPLASNTYNHSSSSRENSAEPETGRYERSTSLPRNTQLSPRPPGEEQSQSTLGTDLAAQSQKLRAKSASDLQKFGVKKRGPPPPPKKSPLLGDKPQPHPKPGAAKPAPPRKPLTKEPRIDKDAQQSEESMLDVKNQSTTSLPISESSEDVTTGNTQTETHKTMSKVSSLEARIPPPRPPTPCKKTSSPPIPPAPYTKPSSSPTPLDIESLAAHSSSKESSTETHKRVPPTPPPPYRKSPSPPTPKSQKITSEWPPQQQKNSPPKHTPIQQHASVDSTDGLAEGGVRGLSERFCPSPTIHVTAPSVSEINSPVLNQSRKAVRDKIDSGFGSEAPDDISLARGTSVESLPQEEKAPTPLSPTKEAPEEWDQQRLEKARSKRHKIALELLSTEKTYVERIKCIAVDFYDQVTEFNVKYKQAIPQTAVQQIFLNIRQIYQLNERILQELQQRMDSWDTHEGLGDVLARLAPFLKLYSMYTSGFEDAMKTLTDWTKRDKRFDTLIREFERNTLTTGLGVAPYMLEPVQRIPRYRLLLADYLKNLPPDSLDRPDTTRALGIISEAADRTNDRIKELENSNEILAIHRSLTDYEGSLVSPSRVFVKKGELQKFSRKSETPRMFFLFSDILLHTKPSGFGIYEFRNEMPIFGMTVEDPKVSLAPHSFNVHSTTRALILVANSEEEKLEWMAALSKVINDDLKKRSSLRRDILLLSGSSSDGFGTKAPIMVPDKSVTMCQTCSAQFSFTFRRHHCRACGKVVCGNCSQWKAYLTYMDKTERVCEKCHSFSRGLSDESDGTDSLAVAGKQVSSVSSGVLNLKAFEEDAVIAAYVLSQEGRAWKKHWYQVKKDFVLYKFKAHEDIKAVHSMPLPGYNVSKDDSNSVIHLTHPSSKKDLCDSFKVEDPVAYANWLRVLDKVVKMELPEETMTSPTSNRSSFEDSFDFPSRPTSALNNKEDASHGSLTGSISKESENKSGSLSPVSS